MLGSFFGELSIEESESTALRRDATVVGVTTGLRTRRLSGFDDPALGTFFEQHIARRAATGAPSSYEDSAQRRFTTRWVELVSETSGDDRFKARFATSLEQT